MKLLDILKLILGTAEEVVPIFVHNSQSQKIEAVIVGTVNGVLEGLTPQPPAVKQPAAQVQQEPMPQAEA